MQAINHTISGHNCLIALGANLPSATGTALETLEKALELILSESLQVTRISKWYSTPAFPAGSGPDFVNAAAMIETNLSPMEVLEVLHRVEATLGRTRENRWEPRLCDLDLLSYDDLILPDIEIYKKWKELDLPSQKTNSPEQLILPHPRMQDRSFVLVPLNDVAPSWVHPVTGFAVSEMLEALPKRDLDEISVI